MSWKPHPSSAKLLLASQRLINEYPYPITFKQLYYRLVAEGELTNDNSSYRKLNTLITNARKHGRLSPDLFVPDVPIGVPSQVSPDLFLQQCVDAYHVDRTENQSNYVEIWVERNTVHTMIDNLMRPYDVPVFTFHGYYTSYAFVYQAYQRMQAAVAQGKTPRVLYFSDLSVSAVNILESFISEMAALFSLTPSEMGSVIFPVGVLPEHVVKYGLPLSYGLESNSKMRLFDARYGDILESIGLPRNTKVELESLDPKWLRSLIFNTVFSILDYSLMLDVEKREAANRATLQRQLDVFSSLDHME